MAKKPISLEVSGTRMVKSGLIGTIGTIGTIETSGFLKTLISTSRYQYLISRMYFIDMRTLYATRCMKGAVLRLIIRYIVPSVSFGMEFSLLAKLKAS